MIQHHRAEAEGGADQNTDQPAVEIIKIIFIMVCCVVRPEKQGDVEMFQLVQAIRLAVGDKAGDRLLSLQSWLSQTEVK